MQTNIVLSNYTTMRLGGPAAYMASVSTETELRMVCQKAVADKLPIFVLGGGSNTIVRDNGFSGLIIHNHIIGFSIDKASDHAILHAGAGENWDEIVDRSVVMNLSGIEALSAIPGTCGGAPVQNIGAYGQELSDTLVSVRVYDWQADTFLVLAADALKLGYRHSIFRGSAAGRYIITEITLLLSTNLPSPPFYTAVQQYFDEHGISDYTAAAIRGAVQAIRGDKLPDPLEFPNAGSFFKNAIVSAEDFKRLQAKHSDIPYYNVPGGLYKIPTGWFIEHAGFKGQVLYGIRVHDKNALVLINESATSYNNLALARDTIIDSVKDNFGITIEQEPLEL